ncbi:MAG: hypothetical protein KC583_00665, partial [Myxococcales bacterium]|nr:hypothetical protein [Myxococcales bacterium]
LPNYQNRDGDWTNGCETAQCTVETVGAQKFGQLNLSCQKTIYEDPNLDDNVDVCACQGTYRCVEIAERQFDVKCIVNPANANVEPDQVSVDYCIQAVGNRNQIRNDRQETCDAFDNDCDGQIDEDFKDDRGNYSTLDHCGACDNACSANNADPRCVRGVCTLAQDDCALNFYDANDRLDDGCEYFCVQTSQDDRVCNGQDDDCDGCRREDPECNFNAHIDEDVPFAVDPQNCGQCGNVCSFPNAFPRCSAGVCEIDRVQGAPNTSGCVAGFADCDAVQGTGCEVEIRSDRNNCGGCGVQCNPTGSNACTGGVCTCGARASCNDPNRPVCDPEAAAGSECVECLDDEDCTDNALFDNAGRRFCINKSCRECNPVDSAGCDGLSQEPICDRQTQTCRGCQNDAQCTVLFGDRPICVTNDVNGDQGQCVLCDPETNAGCGGNTPTCERRNDGTYICRACDNDGDCGFNRTCIQDDPNTPENEARCSGCNILTNEGCSNPTPICRAAQGGGERCSACLNNAECPAGQECVQGSCRECNPQNNAGCEADELCCNFECVRANNVNGCEVCGVACNATTSRTCLNRECVCGAAGEGSCGGATPFCDDPRQTCVSCRGDEDCPAGPRPLCVDTAVGGNTVPQCQECDPEDNRGCDPNSATPVCDPVRYICRGCAQDGECGDPGRSQCVADGSCQLCDPSDNAGCTPNGASVCTNQFQCRGCQAHGECAANPNGNLCTNQRCEACAGANPDAECATHPLGNVCLASVGGAPRRCGACDPEVLGDGGTLTDCDAPRQQGQREGHSAGNICRSDRCVACNADAECAVANPAEPYCFQGRCQACDPDNDAPCSGNTPVCNPFSFQCEACAQDNDCNGGRLCVGGACTQCDPNNNRGCPAGAPVCAGNPPLCRPCVSDQECAGNAAGAFCFEGQCRPCNPSTDAGCQPNSATPVCNPAFACVGCAGDNDCASNANNGSQCIAGTGRCETCDPNGHAGCADDELCCSVAGTPRCQATGGGAAGQCQACAQACNQNVANACNQRACGCGNGPACDPNGPTPRCGANGCVECLEDGDCAGDTVCNTVTKTCQTCRLGTHEGCAANQLCCNNGQGPTCVATGAGPEDSCGACGASCDQARSNRCIDRVCRCGGEAQCLGGTPFCDDNPNNGGADAACVQCLNDANCGALGQCVNNSCGSCDPNDNSGCNPNSTEPFCRDNGNDTQCGGCNTDNECAADNNNGPKCVKNGPLDGACVDCLANADCDAASGTPICSAQFDCVRCTADAQCAGNPNGTNCNVVTGACVRCVDNADCNQQGVTPVCGLDGNNKAACVGCVDDNACVGNPVGPNCHPDGSCEVCANNADCAGQVGAPVCDTLTRTCRACTTANNNQVPGHDDCEAFVGAPVCNVANGTCQECVGNGDCAANELCCNDGAAPTCEATAPGVQCTACDTACNANVADTCANRTCQCGNNAACAGGLFCNAGACVECRNDGDCAGAEVCSVAKTCGAAAGAPCQGDNDCASGYCQDETGLCRPATCNNNQQDNDENGIDCGGPCGKCLDVQCTNLQGNPVDTDCASGFCQPSTGLCRPASCDNGVLDGLTEDEIDCGGLCGACDDSPCDNQNNDTSCASGFCQASTGLCRPAFCGSGTQNGDETGVDCGGSCGACNDQACANGQGGAEDTLCASGYCQPNNNVCKDAHCGNDQIDAGEQEAGIDCGPASDCGSCQGVACQANGDCETGFCEQSTGVCRPFHCSDGQQNNGETGTDCGGQCSACDQGVCNDPSNNANDGADEACKSGYCQVASNRCRPALCNNGVLNAGAPIGEDAIDCGGACGECNGEACADGQNPANHFCASGFCQPLLLTCRATTCNDGVQNNGETGVDCGTAACGACNDAACDNNGAADDNLCASGYCEVGSMRCRPANCANGVQDAAQGEGGVDCGGNCGDCNGSGCVAANECFSGYCQAEGAGSVCRPASCNDGIKNNNETDTDCGGSCGPSCDYAEVCGVANDCIVGLGQCILAGGAATTCRECNVNQHCGGNVKGSFCRPNKLCGCDTTANNPDSDCGNGTVCVLGTCRAASCENNALDAPNETQVDCGGTCGACNGAACNQPDDCRSGVCNNGTCAPPPP